MSKKFFLIVCYSFTISIAVPAFFSVEIILNENGLYVKKLSNFGTSKVFNFYFFGIFALEDVLPIIIIFILNVSSVLKFKIHMRAHGRLTQKQLESRKADIRLTRLIIFLTAICIVSRLLDLVANVFFRLTFIEESLISSTRLIFLQLFMGITNVFLYMVQALDGLSIITMDKNVLPLVLKMLRLNKVILRLSEHCTDI